MTALPGSPRRSVLKMALPRIWCGDAEAARCGLRLTSGLASDGRELLTALGAPSCRTVQTIL